jgi:16S rRNA G966 N2-methylase RsmD
MYDPEALTVSPNYDTGPPTTYLTRLFGEASSNGSGNSGPGDSESHGFAADGSAGYGEGNLDTKVYVHGTAPEKIKNKFSYYFRSFPDNVREKMQMDEIASFSVTEANFADRISQTIVRLLGPSAKEMVITDATACVGGNSMSFGRYFKHVNSIELDQSRAKMLENNLSVCKAAANFGFGASFKVCQGDYRDVLREIGRTDIIFFDPPWGGIDYKSKEAVELSLGQILMHDIVNSVGTTCPWVVLKLPKNYNMPAFKLGLQKKPSFPKGEVVLDEDLADGANRVKMKLVVVLFKKGDRQAREERHQQIMQRTHNQSLNLKRGDNLIKSWTDALDNIGGRDAILRQQPTVRGLYSLEDEKSKSWQYVMRRFPNGVPRFSTAEECEQFCKQLSGIPTNPGFPHLQHGCTTLIGWQQIIQHVLPMLKHYRARFPPEVSRKRKSRNGKYSAKSTPAISKNIEERANLPFHSCLNEESTMNSLMYMFFHMRCGIFVMIRDGKVRMFVPFVNDEYRNTFSNLIHMDSSDGTLGTYYKEKLEKWPGMEENIIPDKAEWWANANILCNQHKGVGEKNTNYWGDHHLLHIRDMLEELCSKREISDLEFFVNKRDHPQLKRDLTEPYDFIFLNDEKDKPPPLKRTRYKSYAPIFSYYVGSKFADFPFPLSDDWASATGSVFPDSMKQNSRGGSDLYAAENFKKFIVPWEKKTATAFFRGNITGGGVDKETNQRVLLMTMSCEWESDPKKNGAVPYLNAKGTGWNIRDKKLTFSRKVTYPKREAFAFDSGRQNYVKMYKQSTFKYNIYVDGHSAANRYAFLMRLGCVIFRVTSLDTCAGNSMWYYPILQPYDIHGKKSVAVAKKGNAKSIQKAPDYLPIKADFSDLEETIRWCRENDDKCKQIAENAMTKHAYYMMEDGILDYLEFTFNRISENCESAPWWFKRPKNSIHVPKIDSFSGQVHWQFGKNFEEKWT